MKWKSDANGLWSWNRHPDGLKSFSENPPTSVDEAINRKTNMYTRPDGTIRTLRAKSRAKPYRGLKFEDENYENRKSNRGNPSKRGDNEKLVTPDKALRNAAYRKMARIAAVGKVAHHGLPVSYLANAEREKPGTIKAYELVYGEGKVGHTPDALVEMTHEDHDYLHNVLEPTYERSINNAGKCTDAILGRINRNF